jgi:hypothetical protein
MESHNVGGVDEVIPSHWHCAGSRNQIRTPLLACDRVEFKDGYLLTADDIVGPARSTQRQGDYSFVME